ncbi:MAG: glycosyltransferase family 4 protein, partial [Oscillospiraceae bacterium]
MKSLIFKIKWLLKFRTRFLLEDKKQKNIALVVNSFNKGGLEKVVLNLYYGYKKQGYQVYILCAFNDAPLAKNLYDLRDIYIFNNSPEKFIEFCWKKHINVLHYHYNTLMLRAARQMGFKVLYTMHNVYTWFSREELIAYKQRLDSANYVVCVSKYVKDYYTAITGAKNAVVINNSLDFSLLDENYEDIPVTRESLGLKPQQKTIGMVASFYPVKNQIGMIGVMESLIKTHPDAVLLCVGNVGDKEYYKNFSELLSHSSARENIIHIEYMDNKYMGQFLRQTVDIFALPTLQEGFSNAVLEAIYAKKPVVITDTGCARDVEQFSSVIVTRGAYDNIENVTKAQLDALSLLKENPSTPLLASALEKVLDNLCDYCQKADLTAQQLDNFTLEG